LELHVHLSPSGDPRIAILSEVLSPSLGARIGDFGSAAATKCASPRGVWRFSSPCKRLWAISAGAREVSWRQCSQNPPYKPPSYVINALYPMLRVEGLQGLGTRIVAAPQRFQYGLGGDGGSRGRCRRLFFLQLLFCRPFWTRTWTIWMSDATRSNWIKYSVLLACIKSSICTGTHASCGLNVRVKIAPVPSMMEGGQHF